MGFFARKAEKFRKLPSHLMFMHVLGKFMFGAGLGILIAVYLPQSSLHIFGLVLILLSMIISIPSFKELMKD